MRSLIILEVEHEEHTDGVQMFTEAILRATDQDMWDDIRITDHTVRIDLPPCFKLA